MEVYEPIPATNHTAQRRKRVKTTTGCWTCRARKVKCDEARPTCLQCQSKELECEGYGVRLRWMPLESGSACRPEPESFSDNQMSTSPKATPQRSQRCQVSFDSGQSPLQLSEIDDILRSIDNFANKTDPWSNETNTSFTLSNFGVFDSLPSHTSPDAKTSFGSIHVEDATSNSSAIIPADMYLSVTSFDSLSLPIDFSQDKDITSTGQFSDALFSHYSLPKFLGDPVDAVNHGSQDAWPQEEIGDATGTYATQSQFSWETQSGAIIRNPPGSQMPESERFLMYHYTHRVVNLFCVIEYEKSPWKTIHLPTVLQGAGQLSIQGSTSTIREALKYALLSISAFFLSNDNKFRDRNDEANRWTNDAMMYRGQALKLLKETVEGNATQRSPLKYKEVLATMLSMITVNLMSGENSTSGIHLDGAFRFMNHAKSWKTKYSPKARSLHLIYIYLRAIHESTAIKGTSKGSGLAKSLRKPEPQQLLSPASTDGTTLAEGFPSLISSPTNADDKQMSSNECVYGIPQSLLVLLARANDLISQVTDARELAGFAFIPRDLITPCDDLESEIINWDPKSNLSKSFFQDDNMSSKIIRKTTLAFHNALIIYFAQHIRLVRHGYLKPYIKIVIDSIEAIEQVKAEAYSLAAPLYWPAFIAGSEAFDSELQDRFTKWYNRVEPYRIASTRAGIDVLNHVWRDTVQEEGRLTSRWRTVIEQTGAVLMLS